MSKFFPLKRLLSDECYPKTLKTTYNLNRDPFSYKHPSIGNMIKAAQGSPHKLFLCILA